MAFKLPFLSWASATFSTEVPSWAAMTPRQGQGAPSMLLCGDLDFGNYSPQHDSTWDLSWLPLLISPLFFTPCRSLQQHSLLSQASWGRLEMKPKRDEKLHVALYNNSMSLSMVIKSPSCAGGKVGVFLKQGVDEVFFWWCQGRYDLE